MTREEDAAMLTFLRISRFTSFIIILHLSGCTTYGPAGETGGIEYGGYTDVINNSNTATVTYDGPMFGGKTRNYLLYRCAQVTIHNGYDYFVILSTNSSSINANVYTTLNYHDYQTDPPAFYNSYYVTNDYRATSYSHSQVPGGNKYTTRGVAVIQMFNGVKSPHARGYYARDVIAHVGPSTL